MKLLTSSIAVALFLGLAPVAFGQGADGGDQVDIKELVKQIRRNMVAVEQEIDRVEAEAATEDAKAAKENLEKLIKSMKGRGDQITSDIDEIIKNLGC
jgi:hypothetical protein